MKSSHRMSLEALEQTLLHASYFQLQAAKHRVLVIRDALAADKDLCEGLLHRIDHLLGQEIAGGQPLHVDRGRVGRGHRARS